MVYSSYEEYMNNLLGRTCIKEKQLENNEIEKIVNNENNINTDINIDTYSIENNEFENFYPDIYKIVYPVVCKRCLNINENITEDLIDNITNEIYNVIEKDEIEDQNKNVNYNNFRASRNFKHIPMIMEEKRENRNRSYLLSDLIKILVLRELIGNGRRPPNPPIPPRVPTPPRPGSFPPPPPPRPEGRPPRF